MTDEVITPHQSPPVTAPSSEGAEGVPLSQLTRNGSLVKGSPPPLQNETSKAKHLLLRLFALICLMSFRREQTRVSRPALHGTV